MNSYLEVVDGIAVGGVFTDHPGVIVQSNWVKITDGAGIGWLWDGTDWTAPADTRDYKQKRYDAYPSWQDQMDMQYHDLIDGTATWKDAVEAVKVMYPKPGE